MNTAIITFTAFCYIFTIFHTVFHQYGKQRRRLNIYLFTWSAVFLAFSEKAFLRSSSGAIVFNSFSVESHLDISYVPDFNSSYCFFISPVIDRLLFYSTDTEFKLAHKYIFTFKFLYPYLCFPHMVCVCVV